MADNRKYTNDEIAAIIDLHIGLKYSTDKIAGIMDIHEATIRGLLNRHYKGLVYGKKKILIRQSKLNKQ